MNTAKLTPGERYVNSPKFLAATRFFKGIPADELQAILDCDAYIINGASRRLKVPHRRAIVALLDGAAPAKRTRRKKTAKKK